LEKNDLKDAEKAIKEIIHNSHSLSAAVDVAERLSADLETASKDYAKVATNLSDVEATLKKDLKAQIAEMTSNLDKSLEVKFAERFSEQAIRMRDLTDQQKELSGQIQNAEKHINSLKQELDKTSKQHQELLLGVKDNIRVSLIVMVLGFILLGVAVFLF